ncbi:hypothetical protein HYW94_03860 [Candidatus Uhrbacteria bacterium]|nr:hypothetical protein [Candidatus Uhrbacteria bacterium]
MISKILPLIRLPAHLDYFDYVVPKFLHTDIRVGQIVRIPFRKKTINGIVIELHEHADTKTLKPIERILLHTPMFSAFQKELLSWFPDFYFVSRATVARMMLISPLTRKKKEPHTRSDTKKILSLKKKIRLSHVSIQALADTMTRSEKAKEPILLSCANEHEKIAFYTKYAQNTIKQKKQLLIICSTISEIKYTQEYLSPYLSSRPVPIHGALRISELRNALDQIGKGNVPVIIGTRMALFHTIPRLKTIIIDQSERMEHKQYDMHPRYHVSTVACALAKKLPLNIILQSHAPRMEDMIAAEKGVLEHILIDTENPPTPLIHLTQEEYIPHAPLISETLRKSITHHLSKQKNVFLFLNKKGLGSSVICQTCHMVFSCEACGRHRAYSHTTHTLSCAFCHTKNPLPQICPSCKGSDYTFLGVGGEKIISSLKKMFPSVPVYEINKDVIPSPSGILGINSVKDPDDTSSNHRDSSDFVFRMTSRNTPCIIVGTSYVPLSHPELFSSFGLVCILRADPSPSLTDFRSHEIQWQTLSRMLMLAHAEKSSVYIQTFQKDDPFISTLRSRDWKSFAEKQLHERKEFGWPPYTRLIALHYHPQKNKSDQYALKNLTAILKEKIGKTARISHLQKRTAREYDRLLITLDSHYTPYESLSHDISEELKKLPAGWLVDIDANM